MHIAQSGRGVSYDGLSFLLVDVWRVVVVSVT